MPESRKAAVVSGFDIVRSIRRPERAGAPADTRPRDPAEKSGGSVALPSRRQIACPTCGWETHVPGRPTFYVCPKCRKRFDLTDYSFDVDFQGSIATGGRVRLSEGATMSGGEIRAADIDVAGRVEAGQIVAWRRLSLRAGGSCPPGCAQFRDLEVEGGAHWVAPGPVQCRRIDVAGRLDGEFVVADDAVLRASGGFRGRLVCRRLIVEEGALLEADVSAGAPPAILAP